MDTFRSVAGLFAAGFIILSSAAHSLLGWSHVQPILASAWISPNAVLTIEIGWHFGSVAMFVLGSIALVTFVEAARERPVSFIPTLLIGIVYVLFGFWALFESGDIFFFIFIIPGLLLGYASAIPREVHHSEKEF